MSSSAPAAWIRHVGMVRSSAATAVPRRVSRACRSRRPLLSRSRTSRPPYPIVRTSPSRRKTRSPPTAGGGPPRRLHPRRRLHRCQRGAHGPAEGPAVRPPGHPGQRCGSRRRAESTAGQRPVRGRAPSSSAPSPMSEASSPKRRGSTRRPAGRPRSTRAGPARAVPAVRRGVLLHGHSRCRAQRSACGCRPGLHEVHRTHREGRGGCREAHAMTAT
jgi:hypothetical protein